MPRVKLAALNAHGVEREYPTTLPVLKPCGASGSPLAWRHAVQTLGERWNSDHCAEVPSSRPGRPRRHRSGDYWQVTVALAVTP